MQFYGLILGALAVWRVTHLLHAESGPWNVLERLRQSLNRGFWSSLFMCFYCLSLWVAIPVVFLLAGAWKERLLLWPALSASGILLERLSARPAPGAAAAYFEEPEGDYDVRMHKIDQDENSPEHFARDGALIGS
jgi:hypothetical protein